MEDSGGRDLGGFGRPWSQARVVDFDRGRIELGVAAGRSGFPG